jgi:hypothetical protein
MESPLVITGASAPAAGAADMGNPCLNSNPSLELPGADSSGRKTWLASFVSRHFMLSTSSDSGGEPFGQTLPD